MEIIIGFFVVCLSYLLIGGIYSAWRWYHYVIMRTKNFKNDVKRYGSQNLNMENAIVTSTDKNLFEDYLRITDYRNNISDITDWIVLWPIYLSINLYYSNFMINIFFSKIYDKITSRVRKNLNVDTYALRNK